jgi:hypothetical protein
MRSKRVGLRSNSVVKALAANGEVATVLGSIPASSDTEECETVFNKVLHYIKRTRKHWYRSSFENLYRYSEIVTIANSNWSVLRKSQPQSTHRVAVITLWRIFHHNRKIFKHKATDDLSGHAMYGDSLYLKF